MQEKSIQITPTDHRGASGISSCSSSQYTLPLCVQSLRRMGTHTIATQMLSLSFQPFYPTITCPVFSNHCMSSGHLLLDEGTPPSTQPCIPANPAIEHHSAWIFDSYTYQLKLTSHIVAAPRPCRYQNQTFHVWICYTDLIPSSCHIKTRLLQCSMAGLPVKAAKPKLSWIQQHI